VSDKSSRLELAPAMTLLFLALTNATAQTTAASPASVPVVTLVPPATIPRLPGTDARLPVAVGRAVVPDAFGAPLTDPKLPVAQGRTATGPFTGAFTDSRLPIATGFQPPPGYLRPTSDLSKLPVASGRAAPAAGAAFDPPNPNLPIAPGVRVVRASEGEP
jgi:hypothetical protein